MFSSLGKLATVGWVKVLRNLPHYWATLEDGRKVKVILWGDVERVADDIEGDSY